MLLDFDRVHTSQISQQKSSEEDRLPRQTLPHISSHLKEYVDCLRVESLEQRWTVQLMLSRRRYSDDESDSLPFLDCMGAKDGKETK